MLYQGKQRPATTCGWGWDVSQETVRDRDHTGHQAGARHRGWLLRRPTFGGLAVALVFWWWSLQPSMLPRSPSAQGR
jgi:uncharacterized membrane protein